MGGPRGPQLKYHYLRRLFTYSVRRNLGVLRGPPTSRSKLSRREAGGDPGRGQCQAGSLTGAVHLSKGNAGVLR